MTSIPVIGTAIVNGVHWLQRLITSIDYPVDNFVVFNNNGRGQITKELDNLQLNNNHIKNLHICHLPTNIGCPAAWNLIIKSYMMAPYWIIVNDDVSFGPGILKEMYDTVQQDPEIGIIHGHEGDFRVGSWDLFLMRDHLVAKFGLS